MTNNANKPVAVIILNWNGEKLLEEFLPSVIEATDTTLAEIIVADNGSTDGSIRLLERKFPRIKTIRFDKNHGYAQGYNLAVQAAGHPYSLLLNSDVAPAPGWINALYGYMEEHPETAACQPKVLSYKNREFFEYAGACGGYIDRNGYPYCRGRIFSTIEKDRGQYDDTEHIFWATGAALMIRSSLYLEAGGLDENFFAHMEEIDLCWRILLKGWQIDAVPSSRVYHLGGGSLDASDPRKTYLNFRNNLLLLHKNLPEATRRKTLRRRRLLDFFAWAKFFLALDMKNAGAVWRAHRDFRKMRTLYPSHPERDLLLERNDCRRDILKEYYLKRKRSFSGL